MSSVSNAGGQPSRRPIALVLAIIGVLGIILGIVYLAVPAGNLPSIFGHTTPANGHHQVRMIVSFVIGVACLVGGMVRQQGQQGPGGGRWFRTRGGIHPRLRHCRWFSGSCGLDPGGTPGRPQDPSPPGPPAA